MQHTNNHIFLALCTISFTKKAAVMVWICVYGIFLYYLWAYRRVYDTVANQTVLTNYCGYKVIFTIFRRHLKILCDRHMFPVQ